MSQNDSPFPTRLVLRLAVLPIALVITAAVEGRNGCHCGSSYTPSPPAAEEDVKKVREAVDADDTARRSALVEAKATLGPRPDLGACPVPFTPIAGKKQGVVPTETLTHYDIPRWTEEDTNGLGHFADELLAIEGIGMAYEDEVGKKPGPHKLRFDSDSRHSISKDSLALYADPKHAEHDFELVIDREVPGKADDEDSFTPAILVGRFYVWSRTEKKVVCAAKVVALSSETLHFREGATNLVSLVASDVRQQAIVYAKEHLSVAGPELADALSDGGKGGADSGASTPRDAGKDGSSAAH